MYSNLLKPSYHGEKSNLFKSYDQARTSFVDSTLILKLTWDANPSHLMPLAFLHINSHISLQNSPSTAAMLSFEEQEPPPKNDWQFSISWRHGSDCEIDIDLAGRPTEMSSMVAARWATCWNCCLLKKNLTQQGFFVSISSGQISSTWISLK